jgi:hypothetical protein
LLAAGLTAFQVPQVSQVIKMEGEFFIGFFLRQRGVIGEIALLHFDGFGGDEFFLIYVFNELHLSYDIYYGIFVCFLCFFEN